MNFKDCILGKINEGAVSEKKGKELLEKLEKVEAGYLKAGRTAEAAALAAEDLLKAEAKILETKQRAIRQHALKQDEISADYSEKLAEYEGDEASFAHKYAADLYQRAAFRGEGVHAVALKYMDKVADKLKGNFLELKRDYTTFNKGIRAAFGETVDSEDARQVGEVIRQTLDYLYSRRQAAGGAGKTTGLPPVSRKQAIKKVSKEEWVDFSYNRLSHEEMIDEATGTPFAPERLKEALRKEYDSIETNGRSDRKAKGQKGESQAADTASVDIAPLRDRMVFKNADAFMEYNAKFGVGDEGLIEHFLQTAHSLSRDIGTLEVMGPKPAAINKFLDWKMDTAGSSASMRKWTNAQFRVLTSRWDTGDVDSAVWTLFSGTQGYLRHAMLGGASISAISDTMFIAATAKINGLSSARAMKSYVGRLTGDAEAKTVARRSGYIIDSIAGSVLSDTRFAGENMGGKITSVLAGFTHKMSGLAAMTRATKDSIALEGMATLAENLGSGRAWADLDPDLKKNLGKFGLKKKDWDDLAQHELLDQGDAKFLITSELRVDPKLDPARSKELADKLDDWLMSLRQAASNEASLATRAITTGAILGDGGPATASRYLMSSVTMFKSFPITVIMTHMLPAIRRARVERKFDHLAMTFVGTTMLGALAIQMKEIVKGKTPKDMDNWKFITSSVLQGGSMGLFGDFLVGDYSQQGRNPITEALGPMVGLVEDLVVATKGNLDKYAYGDESDRSKADPIRDLFRVAKSKAPFATLWYSRLLVEHFILDNLDRLVDPGFDRRMRRAERKMQKGTGQEFWWAPGESPQPQKILGDE